ncbi:unnamed protein product [Adineta steineri]|uniref:Uncharacterized protein n=1 Tax=Adineta steineri TaxID=433720 RepID=A0A819B3F2_9BILA|nr:unnamed protein product [Adineta steineri]
MNKHYTQSWYRTFFTAIFDDLIYNIDQLLEFVHKYIELPIQNSLSCFTKLTSHYYRQPLWFRLSRNLTQILVQSYITTFFLYFILLFFAKLYSFAIQRHYFIDPIISNNRQCINIQFIHVNNPEFINNHTRLKDNFIQENFIIGEELVKQNNHNYTQIHELFHLLQDIDYIICQRSLYLYARYQTYCSLLHSNSSQFRFFLTKYSSSFTIDEPPFLDLCIHASNRSHLEQIQSRLLPLASYSYTSINLFLFDFDFTQVSITFYELNTNSTHLERVSIHTGWLRDIYSQFYSFKYDHALSTVLFDGLSAEQEFVDYFQYVTVPVPSDILLGLNEMIQESILVLPLCQSTRYL